MPRLPLSTPLTTSNGDSTTKSTNSLTKYNDDNENAKKFDAFIVKQITDNIFCIEENSSNFEAKSLIYLIIGEEKACLIDTGFGSGDLNEYIQSLKIVKDKMKIIVINTHNHCEEVSFFIFVN
uniref:Lactamase_B domain-containing protein n=1 Tax=Strongyloides papillosus TaxID=174720 RepID=A0A0N5BF32_STREA